LTRRQLHIRQPILPVPEFRRDQLLKQRMLRPAGNRNVAALRQIKAAFSVSLTAAAFRIMESDQFAAMLVVHNQQGRRYFFGSRSVPGRWF